VEEPAEFKPTWKLSCIFAVLCLLSFLTALDGTVITTSLPTITGQMKTHNDQLYIWIAQCFILSSTAPQPLYGQLANTFGRRNSFLIAIALFALGSGIAGGASDTAVLVTGRTVQGLGAAGPYVLSNIIICDLVPPRNRGPYLSAVFSTAGIGSTIGPVIGGAIAEHNWRWIFYLNIPISALGFVIVVFLLKVNWSRSPTWAHALASVDFLGASIFIPSMISLLYGLITGGTQHPWSSWKGLLSMILGISGWILYHFQQATPSLCRHPSTPPHLFTNRTSATGYALIFFRSIVLYMMECTVGESM
jgi:MFS family permease